MFVSQNTIRQSNCSIPQIVERCFMLDGDFTVFPREFVSFIRQVKTGVASWANFRETVAFLSFQLSYFHSARSARASATLFRIVLCIAAKIPKNAAKKNENSLV